VAGEWTDCDVHQSVGQQGTVVEVWVMYCGFRFLCGYERVQESGLVVKVGFILLFG
jgi:hypothetical protein